MNIYNWTEIDSFSKEPFFLQGSGLSVGSFDGLHLGHRLLLEELVKKCSQKKLSSGLITFLRPLPAIKHSDDYTGDISTLSQRLRFFGELGIDFVILVDFDQSFAGLKGRDFLSILKDKLNMKLIAEGIDFRCGYKGATDTQAIKYWAQGEGVEYLFVDPVYYTEADGNQERVSSSYIRTMIQKGFFLTVKELLARPYEIDIKEIREKSLINQVLPPDGVYHTCNEKGQPVRLKITNAAIENIDDLNDCSSLLFT